MQTTLNFPRKEKNQAPATKATSRASNQEESSDDSDNQAQSVSQNKEQKQPTRKRQKLAEFDPRRKKAYVARKKRFVLTQLMQMPLDILCEIFGHLDPLDLLYISRTTKSFRTMLMTRSTSISIWRKSLANVKGLPACPSDLSEPAFVYLMFGKNCYVCMRGVKPRVLNRDYRIRVKICTRCLLDECSKPNGKFIGEITRSNECAGYLLPWLWPYRPTLPIRWDNDQHWQQAVPSGLDALWEQEYTAAVDKYKWVQDKLDEVKSAAKYQAECLEWFMEYIKLPMHLRD